MLCTSFFAKVNFFPLKISLLPLPFIVVSIIPFTTPPPLFPIFFPLPGHTDPSGQPPPLIGETTPTSVSLTWGAPTDPSGLVSSYSLQRRPPSLSPSPLPRDMGVAFDGSTVKRFPPEASNLGGTRNTISFSFRTFAAEGTILYYLNSVGTDFIAVELREGIPWFFFDAGSGPASIRPSLGGGNTTTTFNDGAWHRVMAVKNGRTGTITVDGRFVGDGQSGGTDQVISSQQVLHVGGIPPGVPHSSLLGLADPTGLPVLSGWSFAGCLFGVTLNGVQLDFANATNQPGEGASALLPRAPGCAVQLERGWSFLGGGYITFPSDTIHDSRFSWTFQLRTTHSEGVVFFAHAPAAGGSAIIAVELRGSVLHLVLLSSSSGSAPQTTTLAVGSNSTCDGLWHSVLIDLSALGEVFLAVDGEGGSLFLPSADVVFSSEVFVGGVATSSTTAYEVARRAGVNVDAPFSGCMRSLAGGLAVGGVASPPLTPSTQHLVRTDGCYSASSASSSSSSSSSTCVEPWVTLPVGVAMQYRDSNLRPLSGE